MMEEVQILPAYQGKEYNIFRKLFGFIFTALPLGLKTVEAYGPDRIVMKLRQKGEKLGRRRCAAYMRDMGLKSIHDRRRVRSLTDSRKTSLQLTAAIH